jgi:diguanylate cyclase (GGDEF)-like protein/putative nucleotidyltransferase with HDIG domain
MLLALVFGVVLVLVGVTASALAAVVSAHLSSARLNTVVANDAALIEFFVNDKLRASDVDDDGPAPARAAELSGQLGALIDEGGILRIEIRSTDGQVLASDSHSAVGQQAPRSAGATAALKGQPGAALIDGGGPIETVGKALTAASVVQEYLPIVADDGQPLAIVALWRDAGPILASLDATRRDIMLVTLVAGILLAGMLLLLFRSSQARLSRQHAQLIEATRRDALTEMLNHGAVVGLLADEVEAARATGGSIGVALVDIDNFRLLNDTHGHEAGDEVLMRVAALVARQDAPAHVARYGPDEFLLVHPGAGSAEVSEVIERLRRDVAELTLQFGESEGLPVSASVGICAYPDHAASVTELLSVATVAVGEAKASGGDRVRVARTGEEHGVVPGSFDVLHGLVLAVDTKDRYTKRHSEDVARYAVFLAQRLGLDEEMLRTVQVAGLLHDIGKIGIPDGILRKPSKLTADEYGAFNQHVLLGEAIVRDMPEAELVRAGIRYHHERWDGRGYVDGLEGEAIPLVARIISVADTFSAMTTTRPYRKALPVDEAVRRLRDAAGSQLQPELVAAFIEGLEVAPDAPMPGEESAALWLLEQRVA